LCARVPRQVLPVSSDIDHSHELVPATDDLDPDGTYVVADDPSIPATRQIATGNVRRSMRFDRNVRLFQAVCCDDVEAWSTIPSPADLTSA